MSCMYQPRELGYHLQMIICLASKVSKLSKKKGRQGLLISVVAYAGKLLFHSGIQPSNFGPKARTSKIKMCLKIMISPPVMITQAQA